MPHKHRRRQNKSFSKKQVKQIKKISRANDEIKQVLNTVALSSLVDGTSYALVLPTIVQGDGDGQRIGNSISPQMMKYKIAINKVASTTSTLCRVYVIQLFYNLSQTSFLSTYRNILPNDFFPRMGDDSNVDSYRILFDKTISLNGDTDSSRLMNINLKNVSKFLFSGDAGLPGDDYAKGNMALFITTLNGSGTAITIDGNMKLKYYDS